MSMGSLSMSQFTSSSPSMNSTPAMKPDSGAPTYSNIGSRLGLAQTPAGGGGGFNIGGMITGGFGGGGLRGSVK